MQDQFESFSPASVLCSSNLIKLRVINALLIWSLYGDLWKLSIDGCDLIALNMLYFDPYKKSVKVNLFLVSDHHEHVTFFFYGKTPYEL